MVNLIRMKLVNFVGIYLGTGQTVFEIDRTNSNNNIILLLGDNGSGKSSIISEMTPIPLEHFGSRNKSRILKDKEGIKELDYLVDGYVLYKIKIVYSPTKSTKCFIRKFIDGKEIDLNPNGNVESYLDVIENELHMRKNYVSVGYLSGSGGSKNFVAMTPSERNTYISEWMPEISEFLDAFRISSKILTKFKKEIDGYNKQIGTMSTINYELELNYVNSNIESLQSQIKSVESKITQLNVYQEQIKPNTKTYTELQDSITKFTRSWKEHVKKYDEISEKYAELSHIGESTDIESLVKELEKSISFAFDRLNHMDETLNIITSELHSNTSLLSDDERLTDMDIAIIHQTIEQNNSLLEDIEGSIEEYRNNYPTVTDDELTTYSENYDKFVEFIQMLDSQFLMLNNFISMDSIIQFNSLDKILEEKEKELALLTDQYNTKYNELTRTNNEIYKYEHGNLNEDILMKRPEFCKTHACGIIEEILKYLDPKDNLQELYKTSKELLEETNTIQGRKVEIEQLLKDHRIGAKKYAEIIDFLHKNTELVAKMPTPLSEILILEPSSIYPQVNTLKLILRDLSDFSSQLMKKIDLEKSNRDLNNLKNLVTNNTKIQAKITELNDKYEKISIEKKLLTDEINSDKHRLHTLRNSESLIRERDIAIEEYNQRTMYFKKIQNTLNIWNKSTHIYNSNKHYIDNTLQPKLTELQEELLKMNKRRDEMTTFYISKKQIEKMRNEIQEQFNRVNILNKIWSPKVGYPSWKIENFLNTLTIKTNEDMNSMWGSNLKIKEFKLEAPDFSIVMEKNGVEIRDASLCSQGEKETINTAISFSIIESNIDTGGYDVIRLDEVDGPLDERRRIGFLDMIQKRINEMNCDSCFIITHNGEFEDIPCDMILLKGAKIPESKLRNKNVLYRYTGE